MKRLLPLFMILFFAQFLNAQTNDYNDLWAKVEQLEAEGLPKSALKVVEEISERATNDGNSPQLIKTMLFKSKFALVLEEDAQLNIVNDFRKQIETSEFPTKNVLESILANMFWQYFNQNRYQFYNRTKTAEKIDPSTSSGQASDFRTWDLQTLFDEIHLHFQNSLQNGLMLQQEPLSKFSVLLEEAKGSKTFRPTLFDFLNHQALSFYKTSESYITKPAYKFEVDNPDFLRDAKTFSELKITSKDSVSLQLNALKIYQDLIQFHLKYKSPLALADVDIQRLKFVNNHATFGDKEALLLKVLKTESERLKSHEASGLYDFEIASIYFQQSQKYQPKADEAFRWKAKEALELCNRVIGKFPESIAAKRCEALKSQIKASSLQITAEDFLPIQSPSKVLVRYKNLNNLQFKIFSISENEFKTFSKIYRKDEQLKFIKKLNVVESWASQLKNEGDYQMHSTEVLIPKFNNGRYIILTNVEDDDEVFGYANIQVTDLALVETNTAKQKIFQVINRNTGAPVGNAKVELTFYENNNRRSTKKNYATDEKGLIKLTKSKGRYRNIIVKISHGNDTGYFGDYYLDSVYNREQDEENYKAFVFTDRSIYRPGQTVYFKAIAMKASETKSEVVPNEPVYATLYNVNGEEIAELEFKTNAFGSVSGEFVLPNNGLNGEYHIEFDGDKEDFYTEHYFSVEEYKRPKFQTKFNPVTETYRLNDSITVKGTAMAYAGSNITDAKVVYRVHRKVQYPRWYFWHRPWFNSEPQEIIHGESMTDENGAFKITFKALPDTSVNKSSLPIFNYEITADVTDVNGETRSATTIVNVGYHAFLAKMELPNVLDKTNKNHSIKIETKNLNGEFVPAKGNIKIFKLKAPDAVLRPRPWPAPDYKMLSKAEFKKLFPHEAYTNEHQPENWEKGELVFEKTFNTETSKTVGLGKIKKWESGRYIIELESKDKFGQLVKDQIKTTLYSKSDNTLADNQLFSITANKDTYKVGDMAEVTLASAAKNITVTLSIEKDGETQKTEKVTLNNNKKTIQIPVEKGDLGGFIVHYSFAAFNSFQSGNVPISVPYPKTDLKIETLTFRDKLQPGSDETWQFKIKGPQGEKVSAELLASMYDASLDQYKSHFWRFNPIEQPQNYARNHSQAHHSFGTRNFRVYNNKIRMSYPKQDYDQLNWFGFSFGYPRYGIARKLQGRVAGVQIVENEMEVEEVAISELDDSTQLDELAVLGVSANDKEIDSNHTESHFDNIQIRKNLQETAFFFPKLQTDEAGNVSFSFKTPEALTQWKLQLLAHTKTLESAVTQLETVTQKELMVIPNAPRFLRHGDQITISTKIANLTDKPLSGQAKIILTDAISGEEINERLVTSSGVETFSVSSNGNTQVYWNLNVPENVDAVQYKIVAKAGNYSDGEQNALPVISNRMLVTESLPMWVKSNETRTFVLDKLKNVTSSTLDHHKLTLEMTSNPAWYAVQALPYLMEYPYECNEQTFSRYYANALASHIANSNPRIQEVFNQWKSQDALISNLEKNEELKSILIQETPWLRDAQSEAEQKKRIALLFDLNKMNNELQSALRKLKNNQMPSGAWAWFNGGYENRYITQYIISGFGHLSKLGVTLSPSTALRTGSDEESMIEKAINYLDSEFIKEYKDIKKYDAKVDLNEDHLSYTQLHYLYMRSFFPEIKKSKEVEEVTEYYQTQIQKYWLKRSLYAKGLMALVSHRNKDEKTTAKILESLLETSITSEELGMYWKSNTNSWFWYQAPIETQALMVEVFSEAGASIHVSLSAVEAQKKNLETIDNLKIWLLKNKQTNSWKTTKATTEAVYALLLKGNDWLSVTDMVDVVLGGQKIEPSKLENVKVEAGTGYFKTSWNTGEIKPEMAEVKMSKKEEGIAWGALYWQYFEDLDKITSAETPLKLKKKLFLKKNTDAGEEISEITENTHLKVGDLVRVRIELRSDRNMEFIHMKDMRAAGLEPVNVISKYKWQDGLGYYESTKDASTNFFFDYLPKGIYVFEYDLRINNAGNMSNGITTIQSMYAPEFSSHSEGVRVNVK
ncbi:alpha-2-macroglobulin family protein [Tamlana crocina]|uniref:Alpha-2-macroglobulin n=1 Tax=Tamlana crocina TaxID=393006 RepID=A0ABX1D8U9_9FLAO|nr:MG2 domain-containing protein [Tamlana crocina]NJX14798.1 alpha-2-macroglobulin [Tamlana crocina]